MSLLLASLLWVGAVPRSSPPVARHALVVASNASDRPGTEALRFADDDGYRWRETLERLGIETTLLTVPDAETARLEGARRPVSGAPSLAAVRAAVLALGERVREEQASGASVDVLVIYVGHGQTDETGRAYLTLVDGQLDQRTLYGEVIDPLGADFVHLIVDACHAGGVVGSRGADPSLLDELKAQLAREQLKARPNVGALFAESEEGETHEWTRLRAGIFSHAARSGLLGAADVNHDGVVGYIELDAFVASAIRGVKGVRGRLRLKTSAPVLDATRSLIGPVPAGPTFEVPLDARFARLSIEDNDGVRLVDTNREPGERLTLWLPVRVTLAELGGVPRLAKAELGTRGGVMESYTRGLFAVPFGRAFFEGYQSSTDAPPLTFEASADPSTVQAPGRFDGAWLGWGLSVGVPLMTAPLGANGVSGGVSLAWRSDTAFYWSTRAQFTFALGTFDGAALYRGAVGVLAGWRGWTALAPFVEVGPQWAPTFVVRQSLQGDLSGFGGRLAVGVMGSRDFLRGLRLSLLGELDAVRIDGVRKALVLPGVELSVAF